MLVMAVLLIVVGAASEAMLGSFRRIFDWRWPKQRYPVGGNHVRVIAGRICLALGVVLLLITLINATS